ncbi:MAG TPA: tail fiber domain-containing protein [Chitinophagales bacterium]|nr:tail fiber domain-containing protein [Chitinophagales bacterium]
MSIAQNVGINATGAAPDNSAILDIAANNKGLLLPRVSLLSTTDVATITTPTISLLVYNTNAGISGTGANGVGYYYWNGTNWVNLIIYGSSNDHDWYKTNTTTSPTSINDSMFHLGFVGIGNNNPLHPLQINTSVADTVVSITTTKNDINNRTALQINVNTNGFAYEENGINVDITSDTYYNKAYAANIVKTATTGECFGASYTVSGSGFGSETGTSFISNSTGSSVRYGMRNIFGSLNAGSAYGYSNFFYGVGSSSIYAVGTNNNFDTRAFFKKGTYNSFNGTDSGFIYGLHNEVYNSGIGAKQGVVNTFYSESRGQQSGVINSFGSSGTASVYAIDNFFNGRAAIKYGIRNTYSAADSGQFYGLLNNITSSGTGNKYGTYTQISGAKIGTHIGNFNSLSGGDSTMQIGVYNGITIPTNATNQSRYGVQNSISNNSTSTNVGSIGYANFITGNSASEQTGVDTWISNTGTGDQNGVRNSFTGTSSGVQIGVENIIANTSNSPKYATINKIQSNGNGRHVGILDSISGSGNGDKYASLNYLANTGNGNHFGADNYFNGTGTGGRYGTYNRFENGSGICMGIGNVFNSTATSAFDKIGIANAFSEGNGTGNLVGSSSVILNSVSGSGNHYGTIFTDNSLGTGDCYGASQTLSGNSSGLQYGVYNNINNSGSGNHYGVYNILSGAGTGQQRGFEVDITNTGNANHYGLVADVTGGTAVNYGTYSRANAPGTTNYGIYAVAVNATTNYAGYFVGQVAVAGNLNPTANNTYDLGTTALRWQDVWCNRNAFNGSDFRLKKNIQSISYGLKEILKIRPVSYQWKDNDRSDLGFIAQEIKEILPDIVMESKDSMNTLLMNYNGVIPVLVKAVQEQQTQIETQNEIMEKQAILLELLRKEIEALKMIDERKNGLSAVK